MKRIKSFSNYHKINEEYSYVTLEDAAKNVAVTMDAVYRLEDVKDSKYFVNLYNGPHKTEVKEFLNKNMNKEIQLKDIPKLLHDIEWFYGESISRTKGEYGPRDMLKYLDFGCVKKDGKYVGPALFKLVFVRDNK